MCAGVSCGFKVSQWFNEVREEALTAKLDRGGEETRGFGFTR
jgi:hypothetical protein